MHGAPDWPISHQIQELSKRLRKALRKRLLSPDNLLTIYFNKEKNDMGKVKAATVALRKTRRQGRIFLAR